MGRKFLPSRISLWKCFLQGVQHHHCSLLLAAVVDCWPSFSLFGSRKLPRFHRCLKGLRQLTTARIRRAMPAFVWEEIVSLPSLLTPLLMAAFAIISVATYVRPSVFLATEKQRSSPSTDAVAPLLVDRGRCFRDEYVNSQRWIGLHGPAMAAVGEHAVAPTEKSGNLEERIWNFDNRADGNTLKTVTQSQGLSDRTMYQTRHSDASIDKVRRYRTWQDVQNGSGEPSTLSQPRPTCQGTTHKRVTGEYLTDIFGGGGGPC